MKSWPGQFWREGEGEREREAERERLRLFSYPIFACIRLSIEGNVELVEPTAFVSWLLLF